MREYAFLKYRGYVIERFGANYVAPYANRRNGHTIEGPRFGSLAAAKTEIDRRIREEMKRP